MGKNVVDVQDKCLADSGRTVFSKPNYRIY